MSADPRLAAVFTHIDTQRDSFVALLIGTVIVIGALTFFPALALGPIVEHLALYAPH